MNRNQKLLILTFIVAVYLFIPLHLSAQSLNVTANSDGGVYDGTVFHTLPNDINIEMSLTNMNDSVTKVQSASYIFGDTKGQIAYSLNGGDIALSSVNLSNVSVSTELQPFFATLEYFVGDSVDIQINDSTIEKQWNNEKTLETVNSNTIPIKVWDIPNVVFVGNENITKSGIAEGLSWSVNYSGGYDNGWSVIWTYDDSTYDGDSFTMPTIMNTSIVSKVVIIRLKVTNIAPDGKTIWYESEKTIKVIVSPVSLQALTTEVTGYSGDSTVATVKYSIQQELKDYYYYWKLDSNTEIKTSKPSYAFILPSISTTDVKKSTLTVYLANEDKSVKSNVVKIPVTIYGKGVVTTKALETTDYLTGKQVKLTLNVEGGISTGWYFEWFDNDKQIDGNAYYNTVTLSNDTSEKVVHIFSVRAVNKFGSTTGYDQVIQFAPVTVWPMPSASLVGDTEIEAYGMVENLSWSMDCLGGNPNGWDIVWTCDGKQTKSSTFAISKLENTKSTSETKLITVSATNYAPDGKTVWGNAFSKIITLIITPYPTVDIATKKISGFSQSEISVKGATNGYPKGSVWNFAWTIEGEETVNTQSPECKLRLPAVEGGEDLETTLTIIATNNIAKVIKNSTITIPITVYSRGIVTAEKLDSTQVNSGTEVELKVIPLGGNPNGWSYQWKDNGKDVYSDGNIYKFSINNNGESVVSHIISVHVKNMIDKEIGYEGDVSFDTLTVWPKPLFPMSIRMTDNNRGVESESMSIREGNEYSIISQSVSGGYMDDKGTSWKQIWTVNGIEYNEPPTLMAPVKGYSKKHVAQVKIAVSYINYGPYSSIGSPNQSIWNLENLEGVISVYAKPKTPTRLERMGNGTTGTLIAYSSLSDTDLKSIEYYLVFGYENDSGEHNNQPILQDEGTSRFDSFAADVFRDSSNKFYVFALWQYDDGTLITSGKRYLDGSVDENWDGSIYDSETRATHDATPIESITSDTKSSQISLIYSMDGRRLTSLKRGLNIMKMSDGSVKKIIVK